MSFLAKLMRQYCFLFEADMDVNCDSFTVISRNKCRQFVNAELLERVTQNLVYHFSTSPHGTRRCHANTDRLKRRMVIIKHEPCYELAGGVCIANSCTWIEAIYSVRYMTLYPTTDGSILVVDQHYILPPGTKRKLVANHEGRMVDVDTLIRRAAALPVPLAPLHPE